MARPRGEDGMTKEEKITCITILGVLFLFIFFVEYLFFHPKIRNISYCNDDRYYMVNAVTGDGRTSDSWHFGAIKKEDYDSWKDGTATTVWVVSSRDENRGLRLRCNMISTITIYDKRYLPFNF